MLLPWCGNSWLCSSACSSAQLLCQAWTGPLLASLEVLLALDGGQQCSWLQLARFPNALDPKDKRNACVVTVVGGKHASSWGWRHMTTALPVLVPPFSLHHAVWQPAMGMSWYTHDRSPVLKGESELSQSEDPLQWPSCPQEEHVHGYIIQVTNFIRNLQFID